MSDLEPQIFHGWFEDNTIVLKPKSTSKLVFWNLLQDTADALGEPVLCRLTE